MIRIIGGIMDTSRVRPIDVIRDALKALEDEFPKELAEDELGSVLEFFNALD